MYISASRRFASIIFGILLSLVFVGDISADGEVGDVKLWTNGLVYYWFDDGTFGPDPVTAEDRTMIRTEMNVWEDALTITDPATGLPYRAIEFRPCGNNCSGSYLVIRYNKLDDSQRMEIDECNNMPDPVGMEVRGAHGHPDGITELHFRRGTCPKDATPQNPAVPIEHTAGTNQPSRIILHELGHALGVWHEFNRTDADRWLVETAQYLDGDAFHTHFGTGEHPLPVLGNYDYDSIVSYGTGYGFEDRLDNTIDKGVQDDKVSERDKSRLLQYYAREQYPNWGFFTSLSSEPTDPDALPNPYLAEGVSVVGTPAIAYQGPDHYDIFARGSDNGLYWKSYRRVLVLPANPYAPPYHPVFRTGWTAWKSIACCFGSDPSAVSRSLDRIDVVAVSDSGEVQLIRYIDPDWSAPLSLRGGHPTDGIKQTAVGGYMGPAIASRASDSLDVFVVRHDGRLAVTTWTNGNWEPWRTLGAGYHVTARPAAVALSATQVQLAINESNSKLYEPSATFSPAELSFSLGSPKGTTAYQAPPALAKRNGRISLYRVLITNADGRISHRLASGDWMDIGGIPKPGTGPSAVATGDFTFKAIMNGEDATGCDLSCSPLASPRPGGAFIQPGGLWIRDFN